MNFPARLHPGKLLWYWILWAVLPSSLLGAEKVYTPVVLPAGTNPAAFAVPREEWLQQVQANFDRTNGKHFDLVFDGDSITRHWIEVGRPIWDANYGKYNAVDFGISGDWVENVLWRLEKGQLDGIDPKLVVLMIGTNNLRSDSIEQIAGGIEKLLKTYLKRAPQARVILLGILPRQKSPDDPLRIKAREVNQRIARLGSLDRVTYLDIGDKFLSPDGTISQGVMPDMLHPSLEGYQIMADAMRGEISKSFPDVP